MTCPEICFPIFLYSDTLVICELLACKDSEPSGTLPLRCVIKLESSIVNFT